MQQGQVVTFDSPSGGGNPPREYCMEVPEGSNELRVLLQGGDCDNPNGCTDDEVELFLKRGEAPDPSDPDGATTEWGYTPGDGAFGEFGKAASPGPWYLTLRDNGVGLGYQDVRLSVEFE